MAIADMRAGTLDIPCEKGDDLTIVLHFTYSLIGYTGWEAKAESEVVTVDDSDQVSDILTIDIPGSATNADQVRWSIFGMIGGKKHTVMKGTLYPEEVPTSAG